MRNFRIFLSTLAMGIVVLSYNCTNSGITSADDSGTVSGKIVDSKNNEPVVGVSIMLINNDFKPDTSDETLAELGSYDVMDSANLAGGVTATTTTDANGNYNLSDVPNGNYSLFVTKDDLSFIPTNTETNPATVIVSENRSVVNFESAILLQSGSRSTFEFSLAFKNLPESSDGIYDVLLYRRGWITFIPIWAFPSTLAGAAESITTADGTAETTGGTPYKVKLSNVSNPVPSARYVFSKGWTGLLETSDSQFHAKVSYTKPNGDVARFETRKFGFVILQEPKTSSFSYDYTTQKVTRTD